MASLIINGLNVCQNSALEQDDFENARKLQDRSNGSAAIELNTVLNDGTNACVFWALGICNTILQNVKKVESLSCEDLIKVAEETITTLPGKVNPFRDTTKRYDPLEAKDILTASNLLTTNAYNKL